MNLSYFEGGGLIPALFTWPQCWSDMEFQLWGFKIFSTPSNVKK